MQPPDRLAVPTCLGCGAMGRLGTCETDCREEKLELVRAAAHDWMTELHAGVRSRAQALREVAEELVANTPPDQEARAAYRSLQEKARAALAAHPASDRGDSDEDEPAESATTWWCPGCGGVDAPQPCLGICVWRPVEWVDRRLYENQRQQAMTDLARERRLRALARRVVAVTPRQGQWRRTWQALQTHAQALEIGESAGCGRF